MFQQDTSLFLAHSAVWDIAPIVGEAVRSNRWQHVLNVKSWFQHVRPFVPYPNSQHDEQVYVLSKHTSCLPCGQMLGELSARRTARPSGVLPLRTSVIELEADVPLAPTGKPRSRREAAGKIREAMRR